MSSTEKTEAKPTVVNRFRLSKLFIFISLVCVTAALVRKPFFHSLNNQGHSEWMRGSPFTEVVVDRSEVSVEFDGAKYQLVSINGATTSEILRSAQRRFGFLGEKRFIEDLPEVLGGMGMSPDQTAVDLVLRDATGKLVNVPDAPMTAENRSRVYRSSKSKGRRLPFGFSNSFVVAFVIITVWWLIPSRGQDAVRDRQSQTESESRTESKL